MKRLFCAVKVPPCEEISEALGVFRQELQDEAIKWVEPQNLHITLKFFGETPNRQVGPIVEALHLAASDCPPGSFRVEGCGTFGSARMPRVIWLGIRRADTLIGLNTAVNQRLSPLGYRPDKTLFTPHLTLGRIRELKNHHTLTSVESEFADTLFARVDLKAFYLIESFLRPQGPLYKVVQTFVLGEGQRA
jgi:RNA 2',3'-cyclic 3'-phosphodiesterase